MQKAAGRNPALVMWRLVISCLLLTAYCLLVFAQPGVPQPNSPLYGARPVPSQVATGLPKVLKNVGIDQKLNEQIPLDAVFKDEQGREVKLGEFFGKKPVVLSLVYYTCPMLCTQVLNGMLSSFRQVSFNIGEQYEVVTVSFDPRETPELAAAKKQTYVKGYNRPGAEASWHFLTGDAANIKRQPWEQLVGSEVRIEFDLYFDIPKGAKAVGIRFYADPLGWVLRERP